MELLQRLGAQVSAYQNGSGKVDECGQTILNGIFKILNDTSVAEYHQPALQLYHIMLERITDRPWFWFGCGDKAYERAYYQIKQEYETQKNYPSPINLERLYNTMKDKKTIVENILSYNESTTVHFPYHQVCEYAERFLKKCETWVK